MTFLLLALLGVTLLIVLWISTQLARVRAKVAVVPEDADVLSLLRRIDNDVARLDESLERLEPRLAAVEAALPSAISHTGVVSYDAFGDIAGNLSRSIALLDLGGSGIVISLLVGRTETLFFTKQVREGRGAEPLSPEEEAAIDRALSG
jgi:uncharacterized protein YlxW (UPF0749 family)